MWKSKRHSLLPYKYVHRKTPVGICLLLPYVVTKIVSYFLTPSVYLNVAFFIILFSVYLTKKSHSYFFGKTIEFILVTFVKRVGKNENEYLRGKLTIFLGKTKETTTITTRTSNHTSLLIHHYSCIIND